MKRTLTLSFIFIASFSFAQKSSEILPVLNVDALISPPNLVFIQPGTNYWQKTDMSHFVLPISQISGNTSGLAEGSNLYYTDARSRSAISAGQELSYNPTTGVMIKTKRSETYSGTTSGSGTFSVIFSVAYSVAPNIQVTPTNASDTQRVRVTSITTTGFTVLGRNEALGLIFTNANGINVDVLINEK